jgi:methylase of polypeptide subunit release factors
VLLQNPDKFDKVFMVDISKEALDVAKRNYANLIEE